MDHVEAPTLKYEDLAGRVEIPLLDPARTDEAQAALLDQALEYAPAVIVVRPGDLELAARRLSGSPVILAAVCGYPLGWSTTSVKLYEARDLLRRGAREVHVTLAVAKLQSRHFQHVEMELIQLAQACHEVGAKLKVIFNLPALDAEQQLVACKIAKRSEVDYAQGDWGPVSEAGAELMLRKCPPLVQVTGWAASAEQALQQLARGCHRVVLDDWAAVLAAFRAKTAPAPVVT